MSTVAKFEPMLCGLVALGPTPNVPRSLAASVIACVNVIALPAVPEAALPHECVAPSILYIVAVPVPTYRKLPVA